MILLGAAIPAISPELTKKIAGIAAPNCIMLIIKTIFHESHLVKTPTELLSSEGMTVFLFILQSRPLLPYTQRDLYCLTPWLLFYRVFF